MWVCRAVLWAPSMAEAKGQADIYHVPGPPRSPEPSVLAQHRTEKEVLFLESNS